MSYHANLNTNAVSKLCQKRSIDDKVQQTKTAINYEKIRIIGLEQRTVFALHKTWHSSRKDGDVMRPRPGHGYL